MENVMMKGARLKATATMIASAIFAAAPRLANACATCGLSDDSPAFRAYKTSALFMVASPYASFAVIGGITYLVYRRSQRQDRKSITK
jgi:phosphatidylglycerophosphate synthase